MKPSSQFLEQKRNLEQKKISEIEKSLTEVERKKIKEENQNLRKLLDLDLPTAYQKVTAQVILRPPNQWFESLIIDRGFESGLSVNQVVMNAEGVVGKLS